MDSRVHILKGYKHLSTNRTRVYISTRGTNVQQPDKREHLHRGYNVHSQTGSDNANMHKQCQEISVNWTNKDLRHSDTPLPDPPLHHRYLTSLSRQIMTDLSSPVPGENEKPFSNCSSKRWKTFHQLLR